MKLSLPKISFYLFLILVFSLAFLQPYILLDRYKLPFTDAVFLPTFAIWILTIFLKKTTFRWHPFYWFLIVYLAAMTASVIFSNSPKNGLIKLTGAIYLSCLAVLTFNLIRNLDDIKKFTLVWLSGAVFASAVGFLTIILFYIFPENGMLPDLLFYRGTLPAGDYPRVKSTFTNGNMFCNYLTASLMLVLIAGKLNWLGKTAFYLILFAISAISLFTISPGLGGIALCLGLWCYFLLKRRKNSFLALLSFGGGIFIAAGFLSVTAIAFESHPTAPFVINLPFLNFTLYPSARLMTWTESLKTFLANPFFGVGLGEDSCRVHFLDPSGAFQTLTDAHNTFLNVAAQTGLFGLAAITLLTVYLTRMIFSFSETGKTKILRFGFGLAFVSCFIYQGLSGSFEDARHIWVIIGVMLSLDRVESSGGA